LNIGCGYRLISRNFLLKIADRDVERAAGEQIRGGIVITRLGKLPVRGTAGEMRKGQGSNKHNKGKNNDERSAFGCTITRMKELFHGVKTFMELEGTICLRLRQQRHQSEAFICWNWARQVLGHQAPPVILRMPGAKMSPGLVGLIII
jgi:hypothetical protein